MKQEIVGAGRPPIPINILVADDDSDDRHFFEIALKKVNIPTLFTSVIDGEKLMTFLVKNSDKLPDILFLDINMPRKNGLECLLEIKLNEKLRSLPIIIFSTSLYEGMADVLYDKGAFYYVRKSGLFELELMLRQILTMITEKKLVRPARDKFVFSLAV